MHTHNIIMYSLLMAHSFLSIEDRIIRMPSWINEALPIFLLHPQGLHIMRFIFDDVFLRPFYVRMHYMV